MSKAETKQQERERGKCKLPIQHQKHELTQASFMENKYTIFIKAVVSHIKEKRSVTPKSLEKNEKTELLGC